MERVIMYLCLAALAVLLPTLFALVCWPAVASALDRWRAAKRSKYLLLPFIIACAYVGSTKHGPSGSISYLYTDVETRYLYDAGSYVTNDAVYVSFNRVLVPDSARFIIEAIELGNTNREDFITIYDGTFATFENPSFVEFQGATNYNFYAYTPWTPGPTVHTNGVVDIKWQRDNMNRGYLIPIRTGVYLDELKISPPNLTIEADLSRGPLAGDENGGNEE